MRSASNRDNTLCVAESLARIQDQLHATAVTVQIVGGGQVVVLGHGIFDMPIAPSSESRVDERFVQIPIHRQIFEGTIVQPVLVLSGCRAAHSKIKPLVSTLPTVIRSLLFESYALRQVISERRWGYVIIHDRMGPVEWNSHALDLASRFLPNLAVQNIFTWPLPAALAGGFCATPLCDESGSTLSVTSHTLNASTQLVLLEDIRVYSPLRGRRGLGERSTVLTPAEDIVAQLLVTTSLKRKEIAVRLAKAEGTIRKHAESVYRKLGVTSRSKLRLLHRAKKED